MKFKALSYFSLTFMMLLTGCPEDRTYYHTGEEFIKETKKFYESNHLKDCGQMFINPLSNGVVIYIYSFCENSIPFISQEAYLIHKKYHITVYIKLYKQSTEEYLKMFFKPNPDIEFIFK